MIENSKIMKENNEIYDQTFINKDCKQDNFQKNLPKFQKTKEILARFLANKYPELFENWSNKCWTFYFDIILQRKKDCKQDNFQKNLPKFQKTKEILARFLANKYPELFENWSNKCWTFYFDIILQRKDTSKVSKEQIFFIVAICKSFLNSNNKILKNDNKFLSKRLKRNLKKMKTSQEFDLIDSDSNEETESDSSTSDEDEDKDEDEGKVSRNEEKGSGERNKREEEVKKEIKKEEMKKEKEEVEKEAKKKMKKEKEEVKKEKEEEVKKEKEEEVKKEKAEKEEM
ncbi:hypothetical protein Glove_563g5 [Diversispora epigaea]|uniref:Uncharacterized protein n=2 Tax=Diversispora epigaea TaxID=1348612 RepID=A0A397GIY4_9GLOM|nr:hypothetical protein Glove_563g5 [Diversispora epigaea]